MPMSGRLPGKMGVLVSLFSDANGNEGALDAVLRAAAAEEMDADQLRETTLAPEHRRLRSRPPARAVGWPCRGPVALHPEGQAPDCG
jgi:hypothetical protein